MLSTARRAARRTARFLVGVVGAATLVFALVILIPGMLGLERYVITGGSMSGSIERGDLVFSESRPVDSLVVGDVITYIPPAESGLTELVTHRIIEVEQSAEGPLFRTQGDANASADPWQFRLDGQTQAVHIVTVPALGWVFIALADSANRMLLLGIPSAIIALMALREIVQLLRPAAGTVRNLDELSARARATDSAATAADAEAPRVIATPRVTAIVDQP